MTPKIKSLGLACMVVAIGLTASPAQASEGHVTTAASTASIFGQQSGPQLFTTNAGQVKCNQALFEGTAADQGSSQTQLTTQELTLTATYTSCTAFGLAATVDMNGCKYTITNKAGSGFTTARTAYVDITGCTSGKRIEVTAAAGCVLTVPEQHNISHITLSNTAESPGIPHSAHANAFIFGVQYEAHGFCPNMTGATSTAMHLNGSYSGTADFLARQDAGSQQATHNGHQYQKLGQPFNLLGLSAT